MWTKLQESARIAVYYALQAAEPLGATKIEPEHLLLGVLATPDCDAQKVLVNLDQDPEALRERIEEFVVRGKETPVDDLTLSSRGKRCIDLAYQEAQTMGHPHVGAEHLLLGVVLKAEGPLAHLLTERGLVAKAVRGEIVRLRGRKGFMGTRFGAVSPLDPQADLRTALRVIRNRGFGADSLSLVVLSEAPPALDERLASLGLKRQALRSAIETELLSSPPTDAEKVVWPDWGEEKADLYRLLGALALTKGTATHRAFTGVSEEAIRLVLDLPASQDETA